MTKYSLDLLNETRLLSKWRDKNMTPISKKLSWQFHDAWMKWMNSADHLFARIADEENKVKVEVAALCKLYFNSAASKTRNSYASF